MPEENNFGKQNRSCRKTGVKNMLIRMISGSACIILPIDAVYALDAEQNVVDQGSNSNHENATSRTLGEIVVTANRRSESSSRVPVSVVALSAQDLVKSNVKGIKDVAALVPGIELDIPAAYGPNMTNVAIRGINSVSGSATTGIYLDDTPIQSRAQSSSFIGQPLPFTWDMSSVEVDRGPQGTLFGAGAEGGTIRFTPTAPSVTKTSIDGHAELSSVSGGGMGYETGVAAGGPIVKDKLGVRASLWYRKDPGYVDRIDPLTGATVDRNSNWSDSMAARLALAYKPVDNVTITPSVIYQRQHTNEPGIFYEGLSSSEDHDFVSAKLVHQPTTDSSYLASLKIQADLGFANLASVSSYYRRKANETWDATNEWGALFGGFGSALGNAYPTDYSQASPIYISMGQRSIAQEVRLSAPNPNARLNWIVGFFYSRVKQTDFSLAESSFVADVMDSNNPVLSEDQRTVDTQVAGFGQVDFHATDKLKLTAGVRVANVKYKTVQYASGILNDGIPPVAEGGKSETPVTPKFGISYQATSKSMFYVSAAKGFRVGGVNTPVPSYCTGSTGPATYNSDSVWSYEAGAKNNLFGGRLRVDASVFHIKWNNIQQVVLIPSCQFQYFENLGTATVNGFDLAIDGLIGKHLRASASVGYTDAKYSTTTGEDGIITAQKGTAVGNPAQVASPWNVTAALEYKFDPIAGWDASMRVEDVFHSKNPGPFTSFNPDAVSYAPDIPQNPAINSLNLRLSASKGNVEVEAFVQNVLNSTPFLSRAQDSTDSYLFYRTTMTPRTFGAGVTLHY